MTENKRFIEFMTQNSDDGKLNHGFKDMVREEWYYTKDERNAKKCVDLLNEQEDKLKRIENEVKNCDIYRDNLKEIVLEIRCILNGDVE